MIENVEEVSLEAQPEALLERKVAVHGEVELLQGEAAKNVASGIARDGLSAHRRRRAERPLGIAGGGREAADRGRCARAHRRGIQRPSSRTDAAATRSGVLRDAITPGD